MTLEVPFPAKTYPKFKEDLCEHYWKVKNIMLNTDGLMEKKPWEELFRRLCYKKDLQRGDIRVEDGSPPEVFWLKFDAAVERWADELPSRGGFNLGPAFLKLRLHDQRMQGQKKPMQAMDILLLNQEFIQYFTENPYRYHFERYLDWLVEQIPEVEVKLADTLFKDMLQYFKDKTPLDHHVILSEYMQDIQYLIYDIKDFGKKAKRTTITAEDLKNGNLEEKLKNAFPESDNSEDDEDEDDDDDDDDDDVEDEDEEDYEDDDEYGSYDDDDEYGSYDDDDWESDEGYEVEDYYHGKDNWCKDGKFENGDDARIYF